MTERKPWHYNVYEGRPEELRKLGRQAVRQRKIENEINRKRGATFGATKR